jgi:hypothetical protein
MRTARSVLGAAACSFIGVDKIASMLNVDFDFAFVVLANLPLSAEDVHLSDDSSKLQGL